MKTFFALLALCAGNLPVTGEFPSQRPVTRRFDVFIDQRLNKRLSRQLRRRWFETPSRSLWRHCNEFYKYSSNSSRLLLRGALQTIYIFIKDLRQHLPCIYINTDTNHMFIGLNFNVPVLLKKIWCHTHKNFQNHALIFSNTYRNQNYKASKVHEYQMDHCILPL